MARASDEWENSWQDAQKGRQQGCRRTLGRYVEDFDEPRTKLAGFFSSLLRREELFGISGR